MATGKKFFTCVPPPPSIQASSDHHLTSLLCFVSFGFFFTEFSLNWVKLDCGWKLFRLTRTGIYVQLVDDERLRLRQSPTSRKTFFRPQWIALKISKQPMEKLRVCWAVYRLIASIAAHNADDGALLDARGSWRRKQRDFCADYSRYNEEGESAWPSKSNHVENVGESDSESLHGPVNWFGSLTALYSSVVYFDLIIHSSKGNPKMITRRKNEINIQKKKKHNKLNNGQDHYGRIMLEWLAYHCKTMATGHEEWKYDPHVIHSFLFCANGRWTDHLKESPLTMDWFHFLPLK